MSWTLDNTILKATARCSTEVSLRHIHGLTSEEDSATLAAGTAAHEALAIWMAGGAASDALVALRSAYAVTAEHVERQLAREPKLERSLGRFRAANIYAIMERYFEVHSLERMAYVAQPDLVEVAFEIPLDDNGEFIFTGRLDAIVRDKVHGQLYVLDHKTTGRIDANFASSFKLSSQMTGYVWAAEQTLGERVAGVFINAIEFAKLPSSDRKCNRVWGNNQQPHGVPYSECGAEHATFEPQLQFDRAPWQLEAWHQTALQLARKFKRLQEFGAGDRERLTELPMEGTFHDACKWCQFSEWCAAGRPVQSLDNLFIYKPWSPLPKGEVVDVVA